MASPYNQSKFNNEPFLCHIFLNTNMRNKYLTFILCGIYIWDESFIFLFLKKKIETHHSDVQGVY